MRMLLISLLALCGAAQAWESPSTNPVLTVYFDTDKDTVPADLPELVVTEGDQVTIVGHADRRASSEYNINLSSRRAANVANAIGVDPANAIGYGETYPTTKCATDDSKCLQPDRRVDVSVDCGIDHFACLAEPPFAWADDDDESRMVTERSRF